MIVVDLCQIAPLSPACVVGRAAGVAGDAVLATLGDGFARAAAAVLDAVFAAIATATTVDVAAPYVTRNAAALAAVALVIVVGLFVVQVATAAVRREPAGLTRAVTGAAVAVLGAGAAGTITAALLAAVDALCEGIAALAGTSITAAGRKLLDVTVLAQLGNVPGGPALMLLFGLLFILGATLTLGTLLVRQALIVIAVVVAPLAFAGATARLTGGWVHRWVQLTLALILSKLAIVIVFVVAVGLLGETSGLGGLLSGLILLLVACLSPWACFKVLDFAGTHLATDAHRATSGAALSVANHARYTATSLIRTAATIVGGPTAGAAAGATGRTTGSPGSARSSRSASGGAGSPTLHRPIPPTTASPGGSQAPSSSAPQTGGGNPAASPAPAGPAGPPATAAQPAAPGPPTPPPAHSPSGGTR